jgi:hypothetical protein
MLAGMNPRAILHTSILSLLLCVGACASLQPPPSPSSTPSPTHLAVIDAGSSGSRLHLYRLAHDGRLVRVEELAQFDDEHVAALASFGAHAADAGAQGVQPLLDRVAAYAEQHHIPKSAVRIDVLATAGMRLLTEADPQAAQQVYASVRDSVARAGFAGGRAATISGADEGRYAWVDVNYLYRNFDDGAATVGIIEVGGASAQIAYASSDAQHAGVAPLDINGRRYAVLALSFLGLGQNEARKAMIAASGTALNACYPDNAARVAPSVFHADIGKPAVTIASGAYSYSDCAGLYRRIIAPFDVARGAQAAGFDAMRFIGLSSIFHALHDWRALAQPAALGERIDAACSGENAWSLKVMPQQKGASKFAQNACANGTYIDALLFDRKAGLGLDGAKLDSVDRINGQAPTWTRGYAVLEGSR